MKDNSTPLDRIANQAISKIPVEQAPWHENAALSNAMKQLNEAADSFENQSRAHFNRYKKGKCEGAAIAYRHVISVLAQLKV
jgi:hypothetical protein